MNNFHDLSNSDNLSDLEESIKKCYSTWGASYYDEYYGDNAPYPPVHRDLIKQLLLESKAKTVLDAGCGSASLLRDLDSQIFEFYGFDLTPEMIAEGRRILAEKGISGDRLWEGSVLSASSFKSPIVDYPAVFDAALCVGVLPHIPPNSDVEVFQNLHAAVKPGGTVIVEARNQLFALFTLNRYSYHFLVETLIQPQVIAPDGQLDEVLASLQPQFRMDLPPVREGKSDEPGYDRIVSRTHNPLVLKEQFAATGFTEVKILFYHFHCLPPMLEATMPTFFREQSLAMEDPSDWRGYFMASAFLLVGQRQ